MTTVLVLCTANICRSPMAGALLARALAERGVTASVQSAGMLNDGERPAPHAVAAMAACGLDISSHRSRRASASDLLAADLTVAMAREHLRHAVVTEPRAWPRAFTLKELLRRGERIGPRRHGEPLADWLAAAQHGRDRTALLGDSQADDVADPVGGPPLAFTQTAALLSDLTGRLAELCWPRPATGSPG